MSRFSAISLDVLDDNGFELSHRLLDMLEGDIDDFDADDLLDLDLEADEDDEEGYEFH